VRAKSEERQKIISVIRSRLHRSGRFHRGLRN
jgi:hypothetical protein